METLVLEPRNKSEARFLRDFSQRMGIPVRTVRTFDEDFEDECAIAQIEEGLKEPGSVSREEIMKASSDPFNPNVPGHCTQEEFIAHIRKIEAGEFMTLEEFDRRHEVWKKEYLARKLK